MKNIETNLFRLVSVGLGVCDDYSLSGFADWEKLWKIASIQGVSDICLDGLQKCNAASDFQNTISPSLKMQFIAECLGQEQIYKKQWKAAKELAVIYDQHGIDTYVMKGFSLSRLFPHPEHRQFTDMDCYLMREGIEAYEEGNRIAKENGMTVDSKYYKHSKIILDGLTVENHQFLLPIKGSSKAKEFERELRLWIDDGKNEYIADSRLKATSPFFDAVYVLAHAQEHFLNEGFVLRHICDWAMVLKANADKVDWDEWKRVCNEYGLLSFAYAMSRLANKVCGVAIPFDSPEDEKADRLMIDDTLYRRTYISAKRTDLQVRIDLVRNMFRNRWKYRLFSDTNFLMFCGRRVWGYLFDKDLD